MAFYNDESYIISNVSVKGLWNEYDFEANLDKGVNIFIGVNGSYKTTLIKLINNLLTANVVGLLDIDFSIIEVKLLKGRKTKKIIFSKEKKPYKFIIDKNEYELTERDIRYSRDFMDEEEFDEEYQLFLNNQNEFRHPRHSAFRSFYPVKKEIDSLINIDYLNVSRYNALRDRRFYKDDTQSIDIELKKLNNLFTRYQNEIKSEINKLSNNFNKDALLTLLFEENKVNLNNVIDIFNFDVAYNQYALTTFLKEIVEYPKKDIQKIDKEFLEIQKIIDEAKNKLKINKSKKTKVKNFSSMIETLGEDLTFKVFKKFPFLSKSEQMIALSNTILDQKKEIEKPINEFIRISNDFIKSKLFSNKELEKGEDGVLLLKISENKKIELENLSSGEKQLLVLLLKTLLQKSKKGIYITDEPELSLHIDWQVRLIKALKDLNPNVQIIFATHSPDIVSEYYNNTIQMEEIIQNAK